MRAWKLMYCFLFILLVLNILFFHTIGAIKSDYITILLLVLLTTIFFIPNIKKIKWGDFEAEIALEEVTRVEKEIKELPEIEEDEEAHYSEVEEIADELHSVLQSDHILALAKLRIELEKILTKILITTNKMDKTIKLNYFGIGRITRILENKDLLDKSYAGPIRETINLCNRAIHGEEVKKNHAYSIIQMGLELLERLHFKYSELIAKPIEKNIITANERDKYTQARYEVITITPYVENPRKNKYILTQEDLDEFLENYGSFAEFLVSIKKLS